MGTVVNRRGFLGAFALGAAGLYVPTKTYFFLGGTRPIDHLIFPIPLDTPPMVIGEYHISHVSDALVYAQAMESPYEQFEKPVELLLNHALAKPGALRRYLKDLL